jgi:uncharacterized protein YcbX
MPVVAAINITPVKSTALHRPDAIDLRREGAVGDRRFLFARLDGSRPSGISKAPLMPLGATWDPREERLTIAGPDGTTVEGDARPHGEPIEVALYERRVPARRIDPAFDVLTASVDPTLTLLRVDEPEYAGGVHRASIVSRATIATLGAPDGHADLDPRRFRMLFELDAVDPDEEDAWRGRRLRVGGAVLTVGDRMPRCVMTTLHPDTGEQDVDTLGMLARRRRVDGKVVLGVYGDVETPGAVAVGDPVELLV